jgi:hypothetical protein
MSIFALDSALWGIYTAAENADLMRKDPVAYAARFALTPAESSAFLRRDYGALLDLGAHPFLMYKMALRLEGGFSIDFLERYLAPLQGHELQDIVT